MFEREAGGEGMNTGGDFCLPVRILMMKDNSENIPGHFSFLFVLSICIAETFTNGNHRAESRPERTQNSTPNRKLLRQLKHAVWFHPFVLHNRETYCSFHWTLVKSGDTKNDFKWPEQIVLSFFSQPYKGLQHVDS